MSSVTVWDQRKTAAGSCPRDGQPFACVMPLVSALMVFHRDTPFLRPAIASVLGQTCTDLELVLVDNGAGLPTDALGAHARDPRIRWVRLKRNEGIPAGHNAGVRSARGAYIALLDYDDIALPNRLERQVEELGARPDLGLVSSLADTIDEQGNVVGREFALIGEEAQRAYTAFAAPVVTPAYTGRREVFDTLPYRVEIPWAADFDFLARAAERWRMIGVPQTLLRYRRHRDQTTEARAAEIEFGRGAVRLLTARRRAGGAERLDEVMALRFDGATPADACLFWARACRRERWFALAAFHARRAVALGGAPAAALAVGLRAIFAARGADRAFATRILFTGPVRALALAPA